MIAGFEWNPWAIPGLVSGLMAWALAALIFFARPDRLQNRFLALAIVLSGMNVTLWSAVLPLAADAATAFGAAQLQMALYLALVPAYLLFLSTLDSPLVKPFANPAARWTIAMAGLALVAYSLATHAFVQGIVDLSTRFSPDDPVAYRFFPTRTNSLRDRWNEIAVLFFTLTVYISWTVYKRQRGDFQARQAKAYLVAFAARDLLVAAIIFTVSPSLAGVDYRTDRWIYAFNAISVPFEEIVFYVLLGYGILRTQLFDIDLKIKWTIKQSTVAGAFIAAFFVVSELASSILTEQMGAVAGVTAAGALVFALAPIQRAAERVSNRAMPHVSDSPAYLAYRRIEVYKGAVEEILLDGVISDRDRRVLERLRAQLDLAPEDARLIEQDLRGKLVAA